MNIRFVIEVNTLGNTEENAEGSYERIERDIMEHIRESMPDYKVALISSKEFPL